MLAVPVVHSVVSPEVGMNPFVEADQWVVVVLKDLILQHMANAFVPLEARPHRIADSFAVVRVVVELRMFLNRDLEMGDLIVVALVLIETLEGSLPSIAVDSELTFEIVMDSEGLHSSVLRGETVPDMVEAE